MDCGVGDKIWYCFQILVVWESIELHWNTLDTHKKLWLVKRIQFWGGLLKASLEIPLEPAECPILWRFQAQSADHGENWGKGKYHFLQEYFPDFFYLDNNDLIYIDILIYF